MAKASQALLVFVLLPAAPLAAQQSTPPPSAAAPEKPPARATQRLYMRDGTYQVVTEFHMSGARVRYFSAERGVWEEVPTEQVDIAKTQQWNRDHAQLPSAKPVDKPKAIAPPEDPAHPEVAAGLTLPDDGFLFATDIYRDTNELVPLRQEAATPAPARPTKEEKKKQKALDVDSPPKPAQLGIQSAPAAPKPEKATGKNDIRLRTTHAGIRLHVADPAIYVRGTVAQGSWVLVRVNVDVNKRDRALSAITPETLQGHGPNALGFKATPLPGGKWTELKPDARIPIGEYALVQVLSPDTFDAHVWDFAIDPTGGENGDAILGGKN